MQTVELLVTLKTPDVTALTAGGTLRRRMGYAETLKALTRTDYYRLTLNVDDEAGALELATELAEHTNLFVNPNKHAYQVRIPGQDANPRQEDGLWAAEVLITDAEGASAPGMVDALQGRLGYGDAVAAVNKGILWTLKLDCQSADQAKRLAEEIVVTHSREQGLLMNPHFQAWEIL